ncbi:unnamed protein product [Linum tenue]|uniref:Uncharacterized protein n=1 Tax=Linum tenue TaxID=586396 RepID=A0AAV0PZ59_9ROSI|nr:unnamed protein product [Linum tenue]
MDLNVGVLPPALLTLVPFQAKKNELLLAQAELRILIEVSAPRVHRKMTPERSVETSLSKVLDMSNF